MNSRLVMSHDVADSTELYMKIEHHYMEIPDAVRLLTLVCARPYYFQTKSKVAQT